MTGSATILRGDARHLPLVDESVDLVVTSPPYYALRSYTDGGEHYAGQIGSEATPGEYIDALIDVTRECVRVLKPSGSIFVDLGDKYSGYNNGSGKGRSLSDPTRSEVRMRDLDDSANPHAYGIPNKSLMLLPERYRIAAVDRLGLIARAVIVWDKPNGLPESVTDRVRRSHEDWVHLTRQPRYYAAVDEIREATNPAVGRHVTKYNGREYGKTNDARGDLGASNFLPNNLGKLPSSVWRIATEPLTVPDHLGVDHFAAYPTEWPRRIIAGWSPVRTCGDCGFLLGSSYDYGMLGVRRSNNGGSPKRLGKAPSPTTKHVLLQAMQHPPYGPQSEDDEVPPIDDTRLRGGLEAGSPDGTEVGLSHGTSTDHGRASRSTAGAVGSRASQEQRLHGQSHREPGTAGEARPRQAAEATPQTVRVSSLRRADPDLRHPFTCPHCGSDRLALPLVLDPFGGTGTTSLVAKALGRRGIHLDASADYNRIATWRVNDPQQLGKARGLRGYKPPAVIDGQLTLDGAP